jgi:hypothetical protein
MKGRIEMKAFGSVVFLIVCLALCGLGCGGGGGGGARDNEPPRISGIETGPSTIIFSGRTVLVRAKVEDAGTGVKEVKLSVTYPDGQSQTLAMVSKGGRIYEVSFEAGWDARQMPTNFDQWHGAVGGGGKRRCRQPCPSTSEGSGRHLSSLNHQKIFEGIKAKDESCQRFRIVSNSSEPSF